MEKDPTLELIEQKTDVNKYIFEEIWQPRDKEGSPDFPKYCPKCGRSLRGVVRPGSISAAFYECDGYYAPKPQIQNHTNKWWGHCGEYNRVLWERVRLLEKYVEDLRKHIPGAQDGK